MYEIEIRNKQTKEIDFIYGYFTKKELIFERYPCLIADDWNIISIEYID